MKEFLNNTAKKYQDASADKVEKFASDFEKATKIIVGKLRDKPFSVRGPLNTSLFDSIFCTIIKNINNLPDDLNAKYETLLKDSKFIDYTTLATTDAKIVKERFAYVQSHLIGK
jgi:hypothetical protein